MTPAALFPSHSATAIPSHSPPLRVHASHQHASTGSGAAPSTHLLSSSSMQLDALIAASTRTAASTLDSFVPCHGVLQWWRPAWVEVGLEVGGQELHDRAADMHTRRENTHFLVVSLLDCIFAFPFGLAWTRFWRPRHIFAFG
jgi:hypothetical protein